MLDIEQIASFYPENLRSFKRNLLREYMQHKILEIIFDSSYGNKLAFMGGTALRIVHANTRFSEDLDFDNRSIAKKEFEQLSVLIGKKLNLEGYSPDIKNIFRTAYRSSLRIPDVLYDNKISGHREEKLLINIDAEPQNFSYAPDKLIINKFDIFLRINVVPLDLLLSQKIYAIFARKRMMGRDFYDTVFLFSKIKPNFEYLSLKLKIQNMDELKKRLLQKCRTINFTILAKEISPFLFNTTDAKKILYFRDYIQSDFR